MTSAAWIPQTAGVRRNRGGTAAAREEKRYGTGDLLSLDATLVLPK